MDCGRSALLHPAAERHANLFQGGCGIGFLQLSSYDGARPDGLASLSDCVRDLIRKDQQQRDKLAALQAAIALGMESGQAGDLDIDSIKRKAKGLAGPESS